MEESQKEQIFCSLDLELTGFDPSTDEILEVGFVFFSIEQGLPVILEQWSKVFKPTRDIRPKILALTGINKTEVEHAPKFAEFREFLQEKLKGVTLVGHSISVDIRFLEAFGVHIEKSHIDTLDLVQFILPTHHSYNLENLMHYFSVPHPEAHRALEDAKATVIIIEKLLGIFRSFPKDLQDRLNMYISKGVFPWAPLFEDLPPLSPASPKAFKLTHGKFDHLDPLPLESGAIIILPRSEGADERIIKSAEAHNPALVVLSRPQKVLEFYRQGLADGLFPGEELFNERRFNQFSNRDNLLNPEILFILKILVWQHTNWQHKTVLDVNWSASGRQFKSFITGVEPGVSEAKVVVTDYKTFLDSLEKSKYTGRQVIIESIDKFERFITAGIGTDISWNKVVSILKSFYNPETGFGEPRYAANVTSALAATDLFFGLVRLLFKEKQGNINMAGLDPYILGKLSRAAEHFVEKLKQTQASLQSAELGVVVEKLPAFFAPSEHLVKWIEISDTRCVFFARSLSLEPAMKRLRDQYPEFSFVSDLSHKRLVDFFAERLEVTDFKRIEVAPTTPPPLEIYISAKSLSGKDLVEASLMLTPSVVVFDRSEELRLFYDSEFQQLKMGAKVFALGYSGGPTKMLRNFGISNNSVLLATANFLYKQSGFIIRAKHLLFSGIPAIDLEHPYTRAQAESFPKGAEEYRTLKTLDLLYSIIAMLDRAELQRITFSGVTNFDLVTNFASEFPNVKINLL